LRQQLANFEFAIGQRFGLLRRVLQPAVSALEFLAGGAGLFGTALGIDGEPDQRCSRQSSPGPPCRRAVQGRWGLW